MSTPKVSFYPLEKGSLDDALLVACRLTEKAVQLGFSVHLLVRSESQLKQLDELLWQYRVDSFLPHQCLTGAESEGQPDCPVTLSTAEQLPPVREVLINLGEQVWDHHQQFIDIREVVAADDDERKLGRQRYRHYQQQGYSLETKQLSAPAAKTSNPPGPSGRS